MKKAEHILAPVPEQGLILLETAHGSFRTLPTKKYSSRTPWVAPDSRQLFSFLPGTITRLLVQQGQDVKKGQAILTFNAMKMDNTYLSPRDGRVARFLVAEQEVVAKGALLVEFE
ncbi:MAG: acetyl-CoA carboxylase biotin carboxyl carrier protein subunit [Mucinivorans sp.]